MKILVDEMYPATVAETLQSAGIDATTVADLGLAGASDPEVFSAAVTGGHTAQYTSYDYTQVIDDHRVLASVGTVGDAYDNAMAESFVDTFKTELIKDQVWQTRSQVELAVLEYVDWFNNRRLHESLGDIPPAEYEQLHAAVDRPFSRDLTIAALPPNGSDALTESRLEQAGAENAADEGEHAKTAPLPVIHERPEAGLSTAK